MTSAECDSKNRIYASSVIAISIATGAKVEQTTSASTAPIDVPVLAATYENLE